MASSSLDSRATNAGTGAFAAELLIDGDRGWRRTQHGSATIWTVGPIERRDDTALLRRTVDTGADIDALCRVIGELEGHFAILVQTPGWVFASVDHIRSIPLFYGKDGDAWCVATSAEPLRDRLGLGFSDIDPDQALAFSMSGFSFPDRTLYSGLNELATGGCVLFTLGSPPAISRHHIYRPWRIQSASEDELLGSLRDVTRTRFERMIAGLEDRPVVVPLSAGLDSRLIVSGLSEFGYRNVLVFAYGLPGNFEAVASQKIAAHLDYPWRFVPLTASRQRSSFQSDGFRNYMRYAESYSSVPFQQEYLAFRMLVESGQIPDGSVIINGQSGDYITGNHIPPVLALGPAAGPHQAVLSALIDKHYSLWRCLKTTERICRLSSLLLGDMRAIEAPIDDPDLAWAAFEASEYQNRQAKYVVNGQRLYESLGFDWRLPLWDRAFVNFWERVPVEQKISQRLYKKMLMAENWGGIWQGWEFPQTVSPAWLRPLRLAAKAAHVPFGRESWHRFEKNWFEYWTDVVGNYAIAPYATVRSDRRGHRNAISWHVEAYLSSIGLQFDGEPIAAD